MHRQHRPRQIRNNLEPIYGKGQRKPNKSNTPLGCCRRCPPHHPPLYWATWGRGRTSRKTETISQPLPEPIYGKERVKTTQRTINEPSHKYTRIVLPLPPLPMISKTENSSNQGKHNNTRSTGERRASAMPSLYPQMKSKKTSLQ